MPAVSRSRLPSLGSPRLKAFLAHNSLHSLVIAALASPPQDRSNPRTPITTVVLGKDLSDQLGKIFVHRHLFALTPLAPGVIPAFGHAQQLAKSHDRVFVRMLLDAFIPLLYTSETIPKVLP